MSDPRVPSTPTAWRRAADQSTRPRRVGQRPRQMFSATVSGGASLSSWKTIEIPASRAWAGVAPVMSSPANVTRPASGG